MGFVYVISATNGHVKIGQARLPYERFSNHQCSSPLPLILEYVCECEDALGIEQAAHAALDPFRTHREWFDVSTEVAISEVRKLLAAAGFKTVGAVHRADVKKSGNGNLLRIFPQIGEIAVPAD